MKASELDYYQRQQLVDKIREQVGYDKYQELADKVGEDTLLDYFLQGSAGSASSSSSDSSSPWANFFYAVLLAAMFLVVYFAQILPSISGPKGPTFWAYLGAIPLTALWFAVYMFLPTLFAWILTYLSVPIVSVTAAILLIRNHLSLWAVPAGILIGIAGSLCARQALKSSPPSRAWALNGLLGWLFGAGVLIAGLAAHFIWHM
jgi:hypothetical protein